MRYYLATTFLSRYENQTWPPHFAREGIESIVFIFGSLWTQQDGSGAKIKYSWLRLPSPSVFPVYQVNGTCSSGMCKFEALIFLENVLILKVVVYLGEATAIRSGNGSFDRE